MLGFDALSESAISDLADPGARLVQGFLAAHLGTPALVPTAVGFLAAHVGSPRLTQSVGPVQGFLAANLGTPALVPTALGIRIPGPGIPSYNQTVAGFQAVHLGTPVALSLLRVAPLRPVNLGTPTTPVARTFTASGFLAARLSEPVCVQLQIKRRQLLYHVVHLRPVKLGVPTAS